MRQTWSEKEYRWNSEKENSVSLQIIQLTKNLKSALVYWKGYTTEYALLDQNSHTDQLFDFLELIQPILTETKKTMFKTEQTGHCKAEQSKINFQFNHILKESEAQVH